MSRPISFSACTIFFILISAVFSKADTFSIGPSGINAIGLLLPDGTILTGSGINIGQVERTRPGKPNFDTLHNDLVDPDFVYYRDGTNANDNSIQNKGDGLHALQVAGVMIAGHSTEEDENHVHGIAPGAILHASAFDPMGPDYIATGTDTVLLTTQRIATISNMRAINMSFALGLLQGGEPNGLQPITAFVDWSARVHSVLYVVAGTELDQFGMFDGAIVPSDNYNGITVAAYARPSGESKFTQVWERNYYNQSVDAVGQRTSTDLLAPGANLLTTNLGNVNTIPESGTSLAAPHVTGTVALLQQFGEYQITNTGGTRWAPNARRHEVMKAVLTNSADKIEDDGTFSPEGTLLGMERTVVKQDGTSTWFDSFAYGDGLEEGGEIDPLDDQMGAGHLNAKRAYQQFLPGEYGPSESAPSIGWDYGTTSGDNDIERYQLSEELQLGNFISITLVWDRFSELVSPDGVYNSLDAFENYVETDPYADDVINDLDLYLVPRGGSLNQYVASSNSLEYTVEHIF